MSTERKKMITVTSFDNEVFEVEESVLCESLTIKNIIEDECSQDGIPLPNVSGKILTKVIEFCRKHVEKPNKSDEREVDEELNKWNTEFVNVDLETLFDLILAANYLNIKSLLDLTCSTVADMIKGKTPEEIRTTFHIVNDYTKEEEEEVRRENAWAFENSGKTTTGYVGRDSYGRIVVVGVHRFQGESQGGAEIKALLAAIQAYLKHDIDNATFEGSSAQVMEGMMRRNTNGKEQLDKDWEEIQTYASLIPSVSFSLILLSCNNLAHKLASWAISNVSGNGPPEVQNSVFLFEH